MIRQNKKRTGDDYVPETYFDRVRSFGSTPEEIERWKAERRRMFPRSSKGSLGKLFAAYASEEEEQEENEEKVAKRSTEPQSRSISYKKRRPGALMDGLLQEVKSTPIYRISLPL